MNTPSETSVFNLLSSSTSKSVSSPIMPVVCRKSSTRTIVADPTSSSTADLSPVVRKMTPSKTNVANPSSSFTSESASSPVVHRKSLPKMRMATETETKKKTDTATPNPSSSMVKEKTATKTKVVFKAESNNGSRRSNEVTPKPMVNLT